MTTKEKEFFEVMRRVVYTAVITNGIENIRGFKVTERGIEAKVKPFKHQSKALSWI